MSRPPTDPALRFWPKVAKTDGCWFWMGAKTDAGYGSFYLRTNERGTNHNVLAHRWAYETLRGPIEAGLQLDHLCRVRHCVSPDHLEPVTPAVNTLRGMAVAAIVVRQNVCTHGHELTAENTYIRPDGRGRQCITCKRRLEREHYQRSRVGA